MESQLNKSSFDVDSDFAGSVRSVLSVDVTASKPCGVALVLVSVLCCLLTWLTWLIALTVSTALTRLTVSVCR